MPENFCQPEVARLHERLAIALRAGGIGLWEHDFATGRFDWDERMHAMYGLAPDQFDGSSAQWAAMLHPDDLARVSAAWQRAIAAAEMFESEFRVILPDGGIRYVRSLGEIVHDGSGRALRAVGANWDITEQRMLLGAVAEERTRLKATLDSIGDAVICTDSGLRVSSINPTAARLTGWSQSEALGRPFAEVFHLVEQDTGRSAPDPSQSCLRLGQTETRETGVFLVGRDGAAYDIGFSAAPIKLGEGSFAGTIVIFNDVTELRENEKKIAQSARRDALTGLPNRTTFVGKLQEALNEARDGKATHVLCFIDLDRFKSVNDRGGHAAGDALLKEVAKLLALSCSGKDVPARLGGDEFALLLRDCTIWNAVAIGEQIIRSIDNLTFHWEKQAFKIGASIGATILGRDSPGLNDVLHQADKACYAAKEAGRNCLRIYGRSKSTDAAAPGEAAMPIRGNARLH